MVRKLVPPGRHPAHVESNVIGEHLLHLSWVAEERRDGCVNSRYPCAPLLGVVGGAIHAQAGLDALVSFDDGVSCTPVK